MNYIKIRNEVLKKISPSEREKNYSLKKFREIRKFIINKYNLESKLMGSVAKDTFLKENKDLDIFIFFRKSIPREKLEKESLKIGRDVFKRFKGIYEIDYAEHPYVKGKIGTFKVEIVPCYKLNKIEEMKSSVDRTPFHTEWINKRLDKVQKEDVLLLKQFLKASGIYGSSLKIEGFSGYLCEILIEYFGSFRKMVDEAGDWKYGEIIDSENYWKKLPKELEKKFEGNPLIVIDPVDKNRNVAAVLNEINFHKFAEKCRNFSRNYSMDFFEVKKIEICEEFLKNKLNEENIYCLEIGKPKLIEDILFPQLRKSAKKIKNCLEKTGFSIKDIGIFEGRRKMKIVLVVDKINLDAKKKIYGPPITQKEHVLNFRKKYKKTWEENGKIVSEIKRECRKFRNCLKLILEKKENGIPENLNKFFLNARIKKCNLIGKKWQEFLMEFLSK